MTRRVLPLVSLFVCTTLGLSLASCGSKSPAAPTPPPAAAEPTRVILLEGNMAFGTIDVGSSFTATLKIRNTGTATLNVSGLSATGGLAAVMTSTGGAGPVAAGGFRDVPIRFAPVDATAYSGTIIVNGDQTSGTNTIAASGTGNRITPTWTQSGTGDSAFDMPTYVKRVRITGTPATSCQNFVVRVAGSLIVNVIVGTCSVADARTHDGTYVVSGGVTQVTNASGVAWTFTEVR